ncbi:sensor histidine kinase [Microbacterium sp. No. 7]|uniref:sensor histidine kinase n=1 Tax=Microbacterium sp. No. 7 TaxID=1714373 RepID=UPI000A46FAC8
MSLRAKVTGVTVAVLAIGLVAVGLGTMFFLRNAQLAAVDQYLNQLVVTDVVSPIMDVTIDDGIPAFGPAAAMPQTQYFVAVYGPDGTLLATAGGPPGATPPEFPETFTLKETFATGTTPFPLPATSGNTMFHAAVDVAVLPGVRDSHTQMIALPLTAVNQIVANYISIYSVFSLLTIVLGALLTRLVVTLTFRGLGQVEQTAMSIAAGDFGQRMTDIAPTTEVGRLKIAINAMLDRVDRAIAQRDASVQQMRRFIGDASHELRTPLVTVRGYAELYRMGAISDADQTAQAMDRIEKEAIRMGMLVEDLLALARLDERRDFVFTPVDLRLVAQDAVLDTRVTAPSRRITAIDAGRPAETPRTAEITTTEATATARRRTAAARAGASKLLRRRPRDEKATPATPDEPPVTPVVPTAPEPIVLGDENRIRQVVTNLLANARRYTPDDSPIEIAVGVDVRSGMGWIAIADHGEGIPAQIRDKIFQRFWRADTSRTRETGGSGLGLSIVAAIVDALHGTIDVTETPGGGATFRASFPLAQTRHASEHLLIETQPIPRMLDLSE